MSLQSVIDEYTLLPTEIGNIIYEYSVRNCGQCWLPKHEYVFCKDCNKVLCVRCESINWGKNRHSNMCLYCFFRVEMIKQA
jgi:hypothetical protein